MSLTRYGLAALVAGLLIPASASANGDSCAKPILWKLTGTQVEQISNNQSDEVVFRHGPVHVTSVGFPLTTGPTVTASSSGPWRICTMSGRSRDGTRWSMPGTYGSETHTSFAKRQVVYQKPEKRFSVAYARRNKSSGGCANPSIAYYASGTSGQTIGDSGASLAVEYSGEQWSNAIARWSLLDRNSRICRVEGYSSAGEPWAIGKGGREGSHVMHSDSRIGTHQNPVMYLWIAFS